MKIHKAILIKPADKYMVRVWDSPEPIQSSDAIRKWNDSYKEYEVHPDYVDRFETYLYSEYLLPDLIKGEDLDPDLIHFEELIDAEKEIKEGVFWNPITYAILNDKPVECDHYFQMSNSFDLLPCEFCGKIKDKPFESEEDIWFELSNGIYNDSNYWKTARKKYTLKRK